MKSLISSILVFSAAAASALAFTEADLMPEALAGKTLTFTIGPNAVAPLADTGTWSGTFGASPGNAFGVKNLTGNTVNSSGTWSFDGTFSGLYDYTIKSFVAGQPDVVLSLWISEGGGRYAVFVTGGGGGTQTGSFTIDATVAGPEITISQPATSPLTDGKGNKAFGSVVLGKTGAAKTFTIKNTGTAPLSGLAISKAGSHKGDFVVGPLAKTTLPAGASTTFKVSFKPKARGTRKASIRIASNDRDENPFDISVSGFGASK